MVFHWYVRSFKTWYMSFKDDSLWSNIDIDQKKISQLLQLSCFDLSELLLWVFLIWNLSMNFRQKGHYICTYKLVQSPEMESFSTLLAFWRQVPVYVNVIPSGSGSLQWIGSIMDRCLCSSPPRKFICRKLTLNVIVFRGKAFGR